MCKRQFQQGFSLIECILAIAISAILCFCLTQLFLASQKSYQLQLTYQSLQQHAAQAISFLENEVKKAGYSACYQGKLFKSIEYDQDSLTVSYMNPATNQVLGFVNAQEIVLDAKPLFKQGETVVIADCDHAEFARVNQVNGLHLIFAAPLLYQYHQAEIAKFYRNKFYINQSLPALFLQNIKGNKMELVLGISYLNVLSANKEQVIIKLGLQEKELHKTWFLHIPRRKV